MSRVQLSAVAITALFGAGLVLPACSSGSEASFCDTLAEYEEKYADSDPSDDEALVALKDLRDSAPGDTKDALSTLITLYEKGEDNLEESDIEAASEASATIDEAAEKCEADSADEDDSSNGGSSDE